MKGWIECHSTESGLPILVNLDNVTCVLDHYIFLCKEDDADAEDEYWPGNIRVEESYEDIKALIKEAIRWA